MLHVGDRWAHCCCCRPARHCGLLLQVLLLLLAPARQGDAQATTLLLLLLPGWRLPCALIIGVEQLDHFVLLAAPHL